MKIHEYNEMMAYLTRPAMAYGGRIGFSEGTKTALVAFVEKFKLDNGRIPTQNEIYKGTGKAAKTIKSHLVEGVDFAKTMSKLEAAQLGGAKPTGITEVSKDIINEVVDLRQRGIYTGIETSPAGSKSIRLNITDPKIKNAFKNISLPATAENLEKIKNEVKRIVDSNIYKEKIIPFQTSEEKRALKRFKEAMYKKQDPFVVYKALQKYKTEKLPGTMSKEIVIQHGQPKFTTQTLSRFGLIPAEVNISPEIEKIEKIRNKELRNAMRKLNNPNLSITDKKKIIEQFNDTMKGLRGQLKGTFAQGAVNFELLDVDAKGNVKKLKDIGFNPKKGLGYGSELGDLDLSKITRQQADEIISLGKSKIDRLVKPANEMYKLLNSADGPTIAAIRKVLKCGGLQGGGNLLDCPMKKFAENPEAVLNKVGQAVPETRTPIMNAFKNTLGAPLRWGGKAFSFAGKTLSPIATPFGAGAIWGLTGFDKESAVDRAALGAEAAFAPELVKMSSKITKPIQNQTMRSVVRGVLNAGMPLKWAMKAARIASPIGWASLGIEGVYQLGKYAMEEQKRFEALSPEEQAGERAEQEEMAQFSAAEGGRVGFATGSPGADIQEILKAYKKYKKSYHSGRQKHPIIPFRRFFEIYAEENMAEGGRVGFDEGSKPKSPGRRTFIKGITALAALPVVGKFFKLGKVLERASTYTGPAIEKIKGMPEWFPGLVKKLWNEGEDVTKTASWKERQVVKRGTLEGGDDVDMFYDLETGNVSIEVNPPMEKGKYETTSGAYNKEYGLEYTKGQADETTKGKKPPDYFDVAEIEGKMDQAAMDIDWDGTMTTVDDAMSDLTELEAFAKNKTTKQIHKKKGTKPKDVFPDYDPGDYDID
jgi:hypothetical protein